MLTVFTFLLIPPILQSERVQASIISDDGQAYEEVRWVRLPTDSEVSPLLPIRKRGVGYAHIRCSSIQPNGQPSRCETSRDGLGQSAGLDADFERAGLKTINLLRVTPETARRWRGKSFTLHVSFAFVIGNGSRRWGDCYPFCQSGLPAAPVAPSPTGQREGVGTMVG